LSSVAQSPVDRLTLDEATVTAFLDHAATCFPAEAVGFLAGPTPGFVSTYVPLKNIATGQRTFRVDAYSQFLAERDLDRRRLLRLAIIHSHPFGGTALSPDDLEFAARRPELQVVASIQPGEPSRFAGYRVCADRWSLSVSLSIHRS